MMVVVAADKSCCRRMHTAAVVVADDTFVLVMGHQHHSMTIGVVSIRGIQETKSRFSRKCEDVGVFLRHPKSGRRPSEKSMKDQ